MIDDQVRRGVAFCHLVKMPPAGKVTCWQGLLVTSPVAVGDCHVAAERDQPGRRSDLICLVCAVWRQRMSAVVVWWQ
jgi:hypothetical protein